MPDLDNSSNSSNSNIENINNNVTLSETITTTATAIDELKNSTETIEDSLSSININQTDGDLNSNNNMDKMDNSNNQTLINEHIVEEINSLQHKQEDFKEKIDELRNELDQEIKQDIQIQKELNNDLEKDIQEQVEINQNHIKVEHPQPQSQPQPPKIEETQPNPTINKTEINENNTSTEKNQQISTPTIFQNLYEHFIVVGLPADSNPKIGVSHRPELLFSYPKDKEVPPKVKEFCFPSGIVPQAIKRTPSRSNLNEMLFGQSYIHSPNHYFTFVLSSENPLYGICITKPELLQSIPNFFPQQPKLLEKAPSYISAPRCYCFLSKIPIFNIHFDALLYLLAQDRLITTTRELLSTEDELTRDGDQEQKLREKKDRELFNEREQNFIQQQQHQQQSIPPQSQSQQSGDSPLNTVDNISITNSDIDSEAEEDIKHLIDKQNLLDILKYYHQPFEIKSGQKLKLLFPNDSHPREYSIPKSKSVQELNALSISEWAVGGTFLNLSLENILRILGAVLLEQRVVFVCDNLATLSSCCFSMISLIHPLVWQGLFVPILPQNLLDYLEAPVPFVFGVSNFVKKNFDGLIVNVKTDKIIYNCPKQPPLIPEFHKLLNNLKDDRAVLVNQKNYNPVKNTKHQLEAVHKIFYIIQQYTQWLFKKIESQFITVNVNDSLEIEEFKQKFLSSVSDHNKDFIRMLLDTQHFNHFLNTNISLQQYQKQQEQKNENGNEIKNQTN
ncbi:hypothetical protein DICPUDRAFT_149772 [Dictyostelium purpureum]|uniref:UDENN domain-containing protein n=1 Tax=Dictyostelium purpureum TaxID=5786 RepID=F0ZEM3_DICPU|nr:uncharacterized protein DICPUDRAFT_149772 [Dictyostelium purpureum]EGC37615.1 hypothetical protein DICPUDRAFT_149772 [Dictyostelium purpureum]|eukprot:XP_003285876.1 hypothetical protein DICPUDRAFT_149772 [Dictyostelium purpureum]